MIDDRSELGFSLNDGEILAQRLLRDSNVIPDPRCLEQTKLAVALELEHAWLARGAADPQPSPACLMNVRSKVRSCLGPAEVSFRKQKWGKWMGLDVWPVAAAASLMLVVGHGIIFSPVGDSDADKPVAIQGTFDHEFSADWEALAGLESEINDLERSLPQRGQRWSREREVDDLGAAVDDLAVELADLFEAAS